MLQSPYRPLIEIGINKYYLLNLGSEDYIAIESVMPYKEETRFSKKYIDKELIQGVYLMEIDNVIKLTFTNLLAEPLLEDLGKEEKTYHITDIEEFRSSIKEQLSKALKQKIAFIKKTYEDKLPEDQFNKLLKSETDNFITKRCEFTLSDKESDVVKELINDGNEFLYRKTYGARTYEVVLINRSTLGSVKFIKVLLDKHKTKNYVLSVYTYVLDREIISRYLDMKCKDFEKSNKGGK